jgi:hypothetical protein
MHVVVRIVELPRLAHASTTRTCIQEADVQGATEDACELFLSGLDLVRIGAPFVSLLPSGRLTDVPLTAETMNAAALLNRNPISTLAIRNRPCRAARD